MPRSKEKWTQGETLRIEGVEVPPGTRRVVEIASASLFDYTTMKMPMEIIHGKHPGPTMFLSAAIHGDEINGVEIIKRVIRRKLLQRLRGILVAVPAVNVFGFNNLSRYLPDRRDLNRCFPGLKDGSLGSRIAYTFMKKVVNRCTHGIDFHTGALHRTNLPQIRAYLDHEPTRKFAESFGVPVIINSRLRDGSLREAARKKNVSMLLFEGGEALRYDEHTIKAGVRGCLRAMRAIGMLPPRGTQPTTKATGFVASNTYWIRAPHSGSFIFHRRLGERVRSGDVVGVITDTFGNNPYQVSASVDGIIIGNSTVPLVNQGNALVHVATFEDVPRVARALVDHDGLDS